LRASAAAEKKKYATGSGETAVMRSTMLAQRIVFPKPALAFIYSHFAATSPGSLVLLQRR
jgi:hypothetical protein